MHTGQTPVLTIALGPLAGDHDARLSDADRWRNPGQGQGAFRAVCNTQTATVATGSVETQLLLIQNPGIARTGVHATLAGSDLGMGVHATLGVCSRQLAHGLVEHLTEIHEAPPEIGLELWICADEPSDQGPGTQKRSIAYQEGELPGT